MKTVMNWTGHIVPDNMTEHTAGTIDSRYKGEVYNMLINLSDKIFVISEGEQKSRIIISKKEKADCVTVDLTVRTE